MATIKPNDQLRSVPEVTNEQPGIYPVIASPWNLPFSRRSFLGVILALGAGFVASRFIPLMRTAFAQEFAHTSEAAGSVLLSQVTRAATWVEPKLLSMVGIAADESATIEKGNHLRWFASMQFPNEAFPPLNEIDEILNSPNDQPLRFTNTQQSQVVSESANSPSTSHNLNEGVPDAFIVYRRKHFAHYDHNIIIDEVMLARLKRLSTYEPIEGVRIAQNVIPLTKLYENTPHSVWERTGRNRENVLNSVKNKKGKAITIAFLECGGDKLENKAVSEPRVKTENLDANLELPEFGKGWWELWPWFFPSLDVIQGGRDSRIVHYLWIDLSSSSNSQPLPTAILGYADNLVEPVREEWLEWQRTTSGSWVASIKFEQGHYRWIKILGEGVEPFSVRYSFMDEDMSLAGDTEIPGLGKWEYIHTVPFISKFQTWTQAKSVFFPHEIKNRYLDFRDLSGSDIPTDWQAKLDYKYAPLFTKLQQSFLRLRMSFDQRYINASGGNSLLGAEFEPQMFYQMWSMDPIIASLYSQRFVDINPPPDDDYYDYLVTTAWQDPAQRLGYIAQKISPATTPPLPAPAELETKQLEGMQFDKEQRLYRAMASWQAPQVNDTVNYGYYEPSAYDVKGPDENGNLVLLTHYVNNDVNAPPGEKIIDIPVRQSESPPTEVSEIEQLPEDQQFSLNLHYTLQRADSSQKITARQVAASRDLNSLPLSDYFSQSNPAIEYTQWLSLQDNLRNKSVHYGVRSIDLFGRTSDWIGLVPLTIKHNTIPAPPANITAMIEEDDEGIEQLVVSWAYNRNQLFSGAPINHFNVLWKDYTSEIKQQPEQRKFRYWQSNYVKHNISLKAPVSLKATDVKDLSSQTIEGTIVKASMSTIPGAVMSEHALLKDKYGVDAGTDPLLCKADEPGRTVKRIITLQTTQCFRDSAPFVDISTRYHNAGHLLDVLTLQIGGQSYDVVSLKPGSKLSVGFVANVDPCNPNLETRFNNKAFKLNFDSVATSIAWRQTLDALHIKEKGDVDTLHSEAQLTVGISDPLAVEITGREERLTNEAWLQYEDPPGDQHRIPIKDYGVITLSTDALWFGSIKDGESATQMVSLYNGSSFPITIDSISKTGAAFATNNFPSSIVVEPKSQLDISVTFTAETNDQFQGLLKITITGREFTVKLNGSGIDEGDQPQLANRAGVERHFLGDLTLSKIVLDLPSDSQQENPAPIFPKDLLTRALNSSVLLNAKLHFPEQKLLSVRLAGPNYDDDKKTLTEACAGEIVFPIMPGPHETFKTCKVTTRPTITAGEDVKCLVRLSNNLPNPTPIPRVNSLTRFYSEYQEKVPITHILPEFDRNTKRSIGIAISTHKLPASEGYTDDQELLVTQPIPVSIQPKPVEAPNIPPITCNTEPTIVLVVDTNYKCIRAHNSSGLNKPGSGRGWQNYWEVYTGTTPARDIWKTQTEYWDSWVDPFVKRYATLPKILDNKKFVQFQLRLDDLEVAGGERISVPENGAIEVLRAPQDALRLLMIEQRKPVLMSGPSGCPDEADPTAADFNDMSPEEMYKKIAIRLINTWTNGSFSPKVAFMSIGTMTGTVQPYLIDQLEGVAAGKVFYAIRTSRDGGDPSDLELLPISVVIPNTSPPLKPDKHERIRLDGKKIIEWTAVQETGVIGYEVYRFPKLMDTQATARTVPLAKLHLSDSEQFGNSELVERATLTLSRSSRRLAVSRPEATGTGRINLYFGAASFKIENVNQILGVYTTDELPVEWASPTYNFSTDPNNRWFTDNASISLNTRVLEGIDLPDGTKISIVFYDQNGLIILLEHVHYYVVPLIGIPTFQQNKINGIFPIAPLTTMGSTVQLFFDSEVHGIVSMQQIVGVYRATPDPTSPELDPGYGAPGAFNHWEKVWPEAVANNKRWFTRDTLRIEGIALPKGTPVVIEYRHSDGSTKALRNIPLPSMDLASIPIHFSGLLPAPLSNDPNVDPVDVYRTNVDDGNNVELWLRVPDNLEGTLLRPMPVRVRMGVEDQLTFDKGSTDYRYIDQDVSSTAEKHYRILTVKQVRVGKGENDVLTIRSLGD